MAQRANRKSRVGVVTSDARDKTVKVAIQRSTRHRRYDKIVRTSRVLHAHDEQNDARIVLPCRWNSFGIAVWTQIVSRS